MDTTQEPTISPEETAEAALGELEAADAADAPAIAERVADALTTVLNEGDDSAVDDSDAERGAED